MPLILIALLRVLRLSGNALPVVVQLLLLPHSLPRHIELPLEPLDLLTDEIAILEVLSVLAGAHEIHRLNLHLSQEVHRLPIYLWILQLPKMRLHSLIILEQGAQLAHDLGEILIVFLK